MNLEQKLNLLNNPDRVRCIYCYGLSCWRKDHRKKCDGGCQYMFAGEREYRCFECIHYKSAGGIYIGLPGCALLGKKFFHIVIGAERIKLAQIRKHCSGFKPAEIPEPVEKEIILKFEPIREEIDLRVDKEAVKKMIKDYWQKVEERANGINK